MTDESPHKDHEKKDAVKHEGVIRTDLNCTNCHKNFIAALDYDIDGYHKIACPRCGHIHYRKIVKGRVTEERNPDYNKQVEIEVSTKNIWKSDTAATTVACQFLREKWLNV